MTFVDRTVEISMDFCLFKATPQVINLNYMVGTILIRVDLLDDGMYTLSFYSVNNKNANNVVFKICVNKQQSGNNRYIIHTVCVTGFTNIHHHNESNETYIKFNHNSEMRYGSHYDDNGDYHYSINRI